MEHGTTTQQSESIVRTYLPRIYLDTCVLISAILESDPEWISKHSSEYEKKRNDIDSSKRILSRWEPKHMKTSPFAVGEFISKGQTDKFGKKTYDYMLELVNRAILPKCEVIYSNLKFPRRIELDKQWKEFWVLAEAEGELPVNGKWSTIKRFLGVDLHFARHPAYGRNGSGRVLDFTEIRNLRYKAPAFEILLFNEASRMAIAARHPYLSDALHLLYAINGDVDIIVTNDKKFRKIGRKKAVRNLLQKHHIEIMSAKKLAKETDRRYGKKWQIECPPS